MDSVEFTGDPTTCRPLPGRVLLRIEKHDAMTTGGLFVPQIARDHKVTDTALNAMVLAIGYGPYYDRAELNSKGWPKRLPGVAPGDVKPGDRVRFKPLMLEMNCAMVVTSVSRLEAVWEK